MKILYIPTVCGGTTANPNFNVHHLDDLGLLCRLEEEGHEVTVATFYRRKTARLNWPRSVPFFFDPGISKGFDAIYLNPKFGSTLKYLANPNLHKRPNYFKHTELVLPEIDSFEGPVFSVVNDARPQYMRDWSYDWDSYVDYQLTRPTHILSEGATRAFPRIMKRIQISYLSDAEDRWSAKWVVENLLPRARGRREFDFIFDGGNPIGFYSEDRKRFLTSLSSRFPNSATLGKLRIEGLRNLSNGLMVQGYDRLWPILTRSKYSLLSWEPFHFETGRLWTPRVMSALASDSLAFTASSGTPFPTFDLERLPEDAENLIEAQHALLKSFAASEDWPVDLPLSVSGLR